MWAIIHLIKSMVGVLCVMRRYRNDAMSKYEIGKCSKKDAGLLVQEF